MFLWIGCKLPEAYEQEIRSHCLQQNQKIGLDTVAFSLPQHISLKISFETDRIEQIAADLAAFFSQQKPFSVQIRDASQMGNILWLTVEENSMLQQLHHDLDARLENRFGIGQHPFDRAFQFHSTLFMDQDQEKMGKMAASIADYPFARTLEVDTILLGTSETGRAGSYRVIRQIKLSSFSRTE